MMIVKLRSVYDTSSIYINMGCVRRFYSTMDKEYPGTTLVYDNGEYTKVKETPDEILEVLKEADPLRSKILSQTDKIDNMLDNMEKNDPWTDLMRRLSDENKN